MIWLEKEEEDVRDGTESIRIGLDEWLGKANMMLRNGT